MKQSLKFGLLLVLALLIHCATNGAMEDMCKVSSPTYRQEKCYVHGESALKDPLSIMPEGLAIFIECVAVGVCLVALYAILAIILIYMERKYVY